MWTVFFMAVMYQRSGCIFLCQLPKLGYQFTALLVMVRITAASWTWQLLVLVDFSVCWLIRWMTREVADLTEKRLSPCFTPRIYFKRFGDSSLWNCSSHQGCNISLSGAAWFRLVRSCLPLDWTSGSFQAGLWRKSTQRQICEYQHRKFSFSLRESPSGNCLHFPLHLYTLVTLHISLSFML